MLTEHIPHEKFFFDPNRHRGQKTQEAARSKRMVGFEQSLKFEKWFVIKRYSRKIVVINSRLCKNVATRMNRERRIMLLARESFLLRRGDDLSIDENRRSTVVVVGRYTENCLFHDDSFSLCSNLCSLDRSRAFGSPSKLAKCKGEVFTSLFAAGTTHICQDPPL